MISKSKTGKNLKHHVNEMAFIHCNTPEAAYLLGLWWADGYVRKTKKSGGISIEMIRDDLESLVHLFSKYGIWSMNYRTRRSRRPQMRICTNNGQLADFLIENDYRTKSFCSAQKILSHIPSYLHHYWFRGLFDGDGCIYINKKTNQAQLSISSGYEQDWTYLTKVLDSMNINYSLHRQVSIRHTPMKSSMIRITNKDGIRRFRDYIYQHTQFGLSRKQKKMYEI